MGDTQQTWTLALAWTWTPHTDPVFAGSIRCGWMAISNGPDLDKLAFIPMWSLLWTWQGLCVVAISYGLLTDTHWEFLLRDCLNSEIEWRLFLSLSLYIYIYIYIKRCRWTTISRLRCVDASLLVCIPPLSRVIWEPKIGPRTFERIRISPVLARTIRAATGPGGRPGNSSGR